MSSRAIFDLIHSVCNENASLFYHISDNDFDVFSQKYIELSEIREEGLSVYLQSQNLHRTYLPVSSFTFNAINQIVWYYDEILLTDPILYVLKDQDIGVRGKKAIVVEAISALLKLKHRIETGYILLTSAGTLNDKKNTKEEAERILAIPSIVDAFEREVLVYQAPGRLVNGEHAGLIQLRGFYSGWNMHVEPTGMYIPPSVSESGMLKDGIQFRAGTHTRISRHELRKLGKEDIITDQYKFFQTDASLAISAIHSARQTSVPGMFLRHVDLSVAMMHAYRYDDEQLATYADKADIYRSTLPFVKGISPEKLMEVREKIPDAFKNFRGLVFKLYMEAIEKGYSGHEINEWINKEVIPLKLKLEAEMKNALRIIRLNKQDLIFQRGSLSQTFKGNVSLSEALTNATTNPTFFLWKAGQ